MLKEYMKLDKQGRLKHIGLIVLKSPGIERLAYGNIEVKVL